MVGANKNRLISRRHVSQGDTAGELHRVIGAKRVTVHKAKSVAENGIVNRLAKKSGLYVRVEPADELTCDGAAQVAGAFPASNCRTKLYRGERQDNQPVAGFVVREPEQRIRSRLADV